jgi:hypothetical protein
MKQAKAKVTTREAARRIFLEKDSERSIGKASCKWNKRAGYIGHS